MSLIRKVSRRGFVRLAAGVGVAGWRRVSLGEQAPTSRVVVQVTDLRNGRGKVAIGMWTSKDGFPKDSSKAFRRTMVGIVNGTATTTFADVPYGEYAIAVYHDENENGKMDTRFPGIPVEGAGASNNPHPHFSAPSFQESRFEVRAPQTVVGITMQYVGR